MPDDRRRNRPRRGSKRQPPPHSAPQRRRTDLRIVPAGPGQWKLQYPSCVAERAEDLAEVEQMVALGEFDCATDELRWLLQECSDLLAAHQMLGTIALEGDDVPLARGHFGIVFDLVRESLPPGGLKGTLPYSLAENQVVYESGRGLAHCLHRLGNVELAGDVVRQLLAWDPSDPVQLKAWLESWGK